MPIRRVRAADAYRALEENMYARWPRRDDPGNRFARFADPAVRPGFVLEPGQRIFTIGSCFARNVEHALKNRGFDVPTLEIADDAGAGADQAAVLNNYVPGAIAPHIRWAFGLEQFDIGKHCAQVRPGNYVDLQLPESVGALPARDVIARRERISAIYRKLMESKVVLITLGLIEAWFDYASGLYINAAPPRSVVAAEPDRFELHVLEYSEVLAQLRDLVALLDRFCPRDYRMIVTVSPVPLTATFTMGDVAVANTYSKAVLRAAAEALVAERAHVDYFPSYESVVLTDRALAFADDQVHVTTAIVDFVVDRMIRRYMPSSVDLTTREIVEQAHAERIAGRADVALTQLQAAWAERPGNPELLLALAKMHMQAGAGAKAEALLTEYLATNNDADAHLLLAGYYNNWGRYEAAALHAETAASLGNMSALTVLNRARAYYHLERYDEGLSVFKDVTQSQAPPRRMVVYWKARFLEKLNRPVEAEKFYRKCNASSDVVPFMLAYAEFLFAQQRWAETSEWVDRALRVEPGSAPALKLRSQLDHRPGQ